MTVLWLVLCFPEKTRDCQNMHVTRQWLWLITNFDQTKNQTCVCLTITSWGKDPSLEIVQSSAMLTSIVAFTHKAVLRDGYKKGTRKIKYTLDGREIVPHLWCRNRFTSANDHLYLRGKKDRPWKSFSFSVSLVQTTILLSVIGLALLLSLRQ